MQPGEIQLLGREGHAAGFNGRPGTSRDSKVILWFIDIPRSLDRLNARIKMIIYTKPSNDCRCVGHRNDAEESIEERRDAKSTNFTGSCAQGSEGKIIEAVRSALLSSLKLPDMIGTSSSNL